MRRIALTTLAGLLACSTLGTACVPDTTVGPTLVGRLAQRDRLRPEIVRGEPEAKRSIPVDQAS